MADKFLGISEAAWVGIQALAACAGFALLLLYTIYTRRMMKLGEITRRVSIEPVLSIKDVTPLCYREVGFIAPFPHTVVVRNVGEGVAIQIWAWHQAVSSNFNLKAPYILIRTPASVAGYCSQSELLKSEEMEIRFEEFDDRVSNIGHPSNPLVGRDTGRAIEGDAHNGSWLYVIEAYDRANGRHQLQILRSPWSNTIADLDLTTALHVKMVHSLGETFGERAVGLARRIVQIIKAVGKELRDLVPPRR